MLSNNIQKIIKQFLLRKGWIQIGLGLIALGCSILVPGIWEVLLLLFLEELELANEKLNTLQILIAIFLIISGLAIFILIYIDQKRKRFLKVELTDEKSWLIWYDEDLKYCNDPAYLFQIPLTLENGNEPVQIKNIDISHYVDGCYCLNLTPKITNRKSKKEIQFLSNVKSLKSNIRLDAYQSENFLYSRKSRAPRQGYNPAELEKGQYHLKIEYSFENENKNRIIEIYFKQESGKLEIVKKLERPPLLNNLIIKSKFDDGVISKNEMEQILNISECDRFYLMKFKQNYIGRGNNTHLGHLNICENIFTKINNV